METEPARHVIKLTLQGTYTPKDYFEEPETIEQPEETIRLSDGEVEVTLKDVSTAPTKEEKSRIEQDTRWIFLTRQVLTGKPCEFSGLAFVEHYSDGKRSIHVSAVGGLVLEEPPSSALELSGKIQTDRPPSIRGPSSWHAIVNFSNALLSIKEMRCLRS